MIHALDGVDARITGAPLASDLILITGPVASGKSGALARRFIRESRQTSTLRDIALAWIFTLPAAALLSGFLYWLFSMFTAK